MLQRKQAYTLAPVASTADDTCMVSPTRGQRPDRSKWSGYTRLDDMNESIKFAQVAKHSVFLSFCIKVSLLVSIHSLYK